MPKKLILVAAPPACGKTYVSERIAQAMSPMVYLDKDDLGSLMRAAFAVADQPPDMDGDFYGTHLRPAEYDTILGIAYSTLRYADRVLLNAPFGKEVRDAAYMRSLKERAHRLGAELLLLWVTAPAEIRRARMERRGCDRDTLKLKDWETYCATTNDTPPLELVDADSVDALLLFDNTDDDSFRHSLEQTINTIRGE